MINIHSLVTIIDSVSVFILTLELAELILALAIVRIEFWIND